MGYHSMRISEERASISNGIDMAYRQKDYTYNPKLTSEENTLLDRLYKFKLSHMAEALEGQC